MKIAPRNEDLLVRRCPFCGSRTILISNTHTACYDVSCCDCGGPVSGKSLEKSWKSARSKVSSHLTAIRHAVGKWNQRSHEVDEEAVCASLDCHISWINGKGLSDLGGTFGPPIE